MAVIVLIPEAARFELRVDGEPVCQRTYRPDVVESVALAYHQVARWAQAHGYDLAPYMVQS